MKKVTKYLIAIVVIFSSLASLTSCEKQDQAVAWKVMNDKWYETHKNDKKTVPFTWEQMKVEKPLVDSAFVLTKSGLAYRVIRRGNSSDRSPNPSSVIKANFEKKLIDGSTFSKGKDSYMGNLSYMEAGLQEGMLKMHNGDIFDFYIPSHLTNSISGTKVNRLIPNYSVVICRIELIDSSY